MNPDAKRDAAVKLKRSLKIFGIAAVLILIVMALTVVNSIFGNPVSAWITTVRIRHYVAETYPDMDLEVSRARFNFKTGGYFSQVQSPVSPDTRFSVNWKDGEIHDGYESAVGGRITTYNRLTEQFDTTIEEIIAGEFPYETTLVLADLAGAGEDLQDLTLDMALDIHHLPLDASLTVWVVSDVLSYEVMAERLLELRCLMDSHDIDFGAYTLRLEEPMAEDQKPGSAQTLYCIDLPAAQIIDDVDNLAVLLEQHQRQWKTDHDK